MTNNTDRINDGKIRDIDIRLKFIERNLAFFNKPEFEFVNEFGINSTNIVDIALFDFSKKMFYGFEIKSETDDTKRLFAQLNAYITFFNVVYVVAHTKLLKKVEEILDNNKQFSKIGLIEVDSKLNFREIRRAGLYQPFYPFFISNLDLEELRLLANKYDLPLTGTKKVLLSKLRRFVQNDDIFEGIRNKLTRYHIRKCPCCGSKLYYNKNSKTGTTHVCFNCGHSIKI